MSDNELLLAIADIVGRNTKSLEHRIDRVETSLNNKIDEVDQRLSAKIESIEMNVAVLQSVVKEYGVKLNLISA